MPDATRNKIYKLWPPLPCVKINLILTKHPLRGFLKSTPLNMESDEGRNAAFQDLTWDLIRIECVTEIWILWHTLGGVDAAGL